MEGEDVGLLDVQSDGADSEVIESDVASGGDSGVSGDGENQQLSRIDERSDTNADQQDKPGDQRTIPGKWKEAIARVKESDPALAKELSRAYFKTQQIDKLGSTAELTALKEAVELHGGIEAIEEMKQEVEAARLLDSGFEKGDPKIIEGFVRDFPDGFKRLMPAAMDALQKLDTQAFNRLGSDIASRIFENYGVFNAIGQLGEALKAENAPPEAVKLYNEIVKFLGDMQGLAKQGKTDPYADRAKELDQREQTIAEQQKQAFVSGINAEVNTLRTRIVNQQMATLLKGKKLDSAQRNRVMREISADFKGKIDGDELYRRQYVSLIGSGDRDKTIRHMTAWSQKHLPTIVSNVLKGFNLLGTTRTAAPAARTTSANGAVNGRPKIGDVDFGRTDQATFLASREHGTAWLKNGKQAKW